MSLSLASVLLVSTALPWAPLEHSVDRALTSAWLSQSMPGRGERLRKVNTITSLHVWDKVVAATGFISKRGQNILNLGRHN